MSPGSENDKLPPAPDCRGWASRWARFGLGFEKRCFAAAEDRHFTLASWWKGFRPSLVQEFWDSQCCWCCHRSRGSGKAGPRFGIVRLPERELVRQLRPQEILISGSASVRDLALALDFPRS